jgi:hypothetical protein
MRESMEATGGRRVCKHLQALRGGDCGQAGSAQGGREGPGQGDPYAGAQVDA